MPKVHLIPHNELREVVARANDIEVWCYLSHIRMKIWRYMAEAEMEDGEVHGVYYEMFISHLEGSENIVEAEIASRKLLQSLPRE